MKTIRLFNSILFLFLLVCTLCFYFSDINIPRGIIFVQFVMIIINSLRSPKIWWASIIVYIILIGFMTIGSIESSELYNFTSFLFPIARLMGLNNGELAIYEVTFSILMLIFLIFFKREFI